MPTFDWSLPLIYGLSGAVMSFLCLQAWNRLHRPSDPGPYHPAVPEISPRPAPSAAQHQIWESLTAREREIARLVARGLRNADIARELQVSTRTVETHLQHTYSKCKIRSRIELALLVRELDQ